jgi:hypothetical protein
MTDYTLKENKTKGASIHTLEKIPTHRADEFTGDTQVFGQNDIRPLIKQLVHALEMVQQHAGIDGMCIDVDNEVYLDTIVEEALAAARIIP